MVSFLLAVKENKKEISSPGILGIVGIIGIIVFAKTLYSRYFVLIVCLYMIIFACFFERLVQTRYKWKYLMAVLILIAVNFQSIGSIACFVRDPLEAPFIKQDIEQYITGQFSGYGIVQVRDELIRRARGEETYVFVSNSFGHPETMVPSWFHT